MLLVFLYFTLFFFGFVCGTLKDKYHVALERFCQRNEGLEGLADR